MFWIVLILGIIGYITYNFLKDRDRMLQRQVDIHGGMSKKYEHLIKRLTNDLSTQVVKVTRDHIHIQFSGQATTTNFIIVESFGTVEIEWIGQMAMFGTHKHKWSFPHNYPQEKIAQEIEEYMEWKVKQMFGNSL